MPADTCLSWIYNSFMYGPQTFVKFIGFDDWDKIVLLSTNLCLMKEYSLDSMVLWNIG